MILLKWLLIQKHYQELCEKVSYDDLIREIERYGGFEKVLNSIRIIKICSFFLSGL